MVRSVQLLNGNEVLNVTEATCTSQERAFYYDYDKPH